VNPADLQVKRQGIDHEADVDSCMSEEDADLLGRLTAMSEVLVFLLARDLVERPADQARAVADSLINAERNLMQGAGLMDANALQSVRLAAKNTSTMIVTQALTLVEAWRASRKGE